MTTILDLLGLSALVVGAFLLSVPLGFFAAGAALLVVSWRRSR